MYNAGCYGIVYFEGIGIDAFPRQTIHSLIVSYNWTGCDKWFIDATFKSLAIARLWFHNSITNYCNIYI